MLILRYAENLPPTASLACFGIKTGSRITSFTDNNFYFLLFIIFYNTSPVCRHRQLPADKLHLPFSITQS